MTPTNGDHRAVSVARILAVQERCHTRLAQIDEGVEVTGSSLEPIALVEVEYLVRDTFEAVEAAGYSVVPTDLLRRIRECEGLQEWDMRLCDELDEAMGIPSYCAPPERPSS